MKERLLTLLTDDNGQDVIEYALLAALIALSALAAMHKLDKRLITDYTKIGKRV